MLANNSAGARSLIYGSMRDHILEVKLALEGGEKIYCRPLSDDAYHQKLHQENREGYIYKDIDKSSKLMQPTSTKTRLQFPDMSGYNLKGLLRRPYHNLSKLIAGSEGTLGIAHGNEAAHRQKTALTPVCAFSSSTISSPHSNTSPLC